MHYIGLNIRELCEQKIEHLLVLVFLCLSLRRLKPGLPSIPSPTRLKNLAVPVILTEMTLFTEKYILLLFFSKCRTETAKRSTGHHSPQLQAAAWNRCLVWKSPASFWYIFTKDKAHSITVGSTGLVAQKTKSYTNSNMLQVKSNEGHYQCPKSPHHQEICQLKMSKWKMALHPYSISNCFLLCFAQMTSVVS